MNTTLRFLVVLILATLTANPFASANPDSVFTQGCALYADGKYGEAIEAFKKIEILGKVSPALYYNLGNSLYKSNQITEAILYYERALKLNPSDEDLIFNLQIANLKTVDRIIPVPVFFFNKWMENLRDTYSSDTWAWTAIISFFVAFLFLVLFRISQNPGAKRSWFYLSIFVFIIGGTCILFASNQKSSIESNQTAIVFASTLTVKSSPDVSGSNLFVIHEGTKVQILDAVGEWSKIKLLDGNVGWVKTDSFVLI